MTVVSPAPTRAVDPRKPGHQHPSFDTGVRSLVVTAVRELTDAIVQIVLEDPAGGMLAAYEPGSHLIVQAGPVRNTYSLIDDGVNPHRYAISVLRRSAPVPAGGSAESSGSAWLHDYVQVGRRVEIEGPRSLFAPVTTERKALLIAGGIGVTPILSHTRAAARWGRPAEVIYSYRAGCGAHRDDLRALAASGAITLHEVHTRTDAAALLSERLAAQPMGTHAYACGPPAFVDRYLELGEAAGWPADRLHSERFEVPPQDAGLPFAAIIASTGARLAVPAGVSLLQTLLDNGHDVANLCRQGVCGECRIPVRSGQIEHRDYVLSEREKADNTTMLCCVSRGAEIEVDL
ncbi:PDR/VanB family oxidoreductase [Cryobacterium luteum]|uniref:Oxidoreductase n=1 Tax=Cryobacterium luteum TaxID=1424661 RepID=A0A1H8KA41_9MICO|nr:PDR/VanB family oxidoreductase [Cryobacterium luteum]TFB92378.1 oxidoreductase [Cryobacterium luteum]SEN89308.1 Ferredoxin-NADP reductase [Cryobacterium luteum]